MRFALIFAVFAPLALADVSFTSSDAKRLYQLEKEFDTYISELKIGAKAHLYGSASVCLQDNGSISIRDAKVVSSESDVPSYSDVWFLVSRESKNEVSLELVLKKGEADGDDIMRKVAMLAPSFACSSLNDVQTARYKAMQYFGISSIEGLTNFSDILERAEHLSKIYAKP